MTSADIIIHLFCVVDDQMDDIPKHSQAKLSDHRIAVCPEGRLVSPVLPLVSARLYNSFWGPGGANAPAALFAMPS
jgi:hypothetical protein